MENSRIFQQCDQVDKKLKYQNYEFTMDIMSMRIE